MNDELRRRAAELWPMIPWYTPLRDRNKVWRLCALCPRSFVTGRDGPYLCQKCRVEIGKKHEESQS